MNKGRPFLSIFAATTLTVALTFAMVLLASQVRAFSLLGPYADWMDVTNAFRQPGDIGGPMDIKEGYRWNVPVVTYGFDQSFLDYFGSNGVSAVEAAIQILNDLPPASASALTNFPFWSRRNNFTAGARGLYDLKSATLWALIEQLGLAQPTRHMFSLRRWDSSLEGFFDRDHGPPWPLGVVSNFIIGRNFDPNTLMATNAINGVDFSAFVWYDKQGANGVAPYADVIEVLIDPLSSAQTVADSSLVNPYDQGGFYTGLTRDDVGGLFFLLGTNNSNFETVLPTVHAATVNGSFVNAALRPGVDKISFIPHPFDAALRTFLPTTNHFTDTLVTNGLVLQQQLERVITQPDFLFCAGDNGKDRSRTCAILSTGTANWINNAALNGGTNQLGPGVIVPPVRIVFHQIGPCVISQEPALEGDPYISAQHWGSFDGSTNLPVSFPSVGSESGRVLRFRLRLFQSADAPLASYTWQLPVSIGGTATLQTSTNLSDWTPLTTITNSGGIIEWFHYGLVSEKRFFRVVPQTGSN